jgi:hypothetical protein
MSGFFGNISVGRAYIGFKKIPDDMGFSFSGIFKIFDKCPYMVLNLK